MTAHLDALVRELADAVKGDADDLPVRLRKGVVFAQSPLTVKIGGSTIAVPVQATGPIPANGTVVWVLESGPRRIMLDAARTHDHGAPTALAKIANKPNSDLPRSYPEGATMMFPGDAGYPTNFPAVLTLRAGNDVAQTCYGIVANSVWYRYANSDGDSWTAWSRVALIDSGGTLNVGGYIHAHQGHATWETRIGEIVGFAGLFAPRSAMMFYTEGSNGWTWRTGNAEKMYLTTNSDLVVNRNIDGLGGVFDKGRRVVWAGQPGGGSNVEYSGTFRDGFDLNQYLGEGRYNLVNSTNNPWGDGRWCWLDVYQHVSGAHWQKQIIHDMTGGATSYFRRCAGGNPTLAESWSGWSYMHG